MSASLLFIPDISGFTRFVQTTEVEHSQHVIAELLEVLISANTQQLRLAEIEGDALFFYKENNIPSQEKLLAQVESMYTAFYSHLRLLKKHRICPCNACATAPNLELKIVVHAGDLQFIEVQGNRKPFGESVIQAHRLLKNSVPSDNYVLLSKSLVDAIELSRNYESMLFRFVEGKDSYDGTFIDYSYSVIETHKLKLNLFKQGIVYEPNRRANLEMVRKFPVAAETLIEYITNYKFRHLWAEGAEKIDWNEHEVTRMGSEHACTVGGKLLDFIVVTKETTSNEIIYGELTSSPPPVDKLYQFYSVTPISEEQSNLHYEMYWEAKSPFKKLLIFLFAKNAFRKGYKKALNDLERIVQKQILQ